MLSARLFVLWVSIAHAFSAIWESFSLLEQFESCCLQKDAYLHAVTFIFLSQGAQLRSHASTLSVTENCAEHHLVFTFTFLPSLVVLLDSPHVQIFLNK